MTRAIAGLCALLLLAAVCGANTPTDHPYHNLYLTELSSVNNLALNPQDNYCYGTFSDRILKSNGGSWSLVCDMSDEGYATTSVTSLFFTAAGDLLISGPEAGMDSLRKAESVDYTTWTSVLEWPCSDHEDDCKPFANSGFCEGGADTLFVGQYCGANPTDTCATVWRSDDAGDTWAEKYHLASRHIHGVWYDSLIDSVYASVGDTPESCLIIGSPDRGENWTVLRRWTSGSNGPLSFAALPGIRFFGSDAYDEANSVFSTTDDAAFADTLDLSGDREGYIWVMSQDAEGVIYASTLKKGIPGTDTIAIYYRQPWDDGKWYKHDLGTQAAQWNGVTHMTAFDASGYAYFRYQDEGDDDAVFKFTRSPTYTVGSGGDFATIAAAVTSGVVAPGDTLILLAGTHAAGMNQALPHNLTITGATSDRSLYTIKNGGTSGDVFDIDSTAVFMDLTVRVIGTAITESFFEGTAVTTDITFDNVAFQRVASSGQASIFYSDDDGHKVKFENCRMESCNTSDELVLLLLTEQFIFRNCIVADNISDEDAQIMLASFSATHDTVMISYSLFADNRSEDAGCLRVNGNTDASRQIVKHCTFDNNECDPGGTNYVDGQLFLSSTSANVDVTHCIFTGADSTYAISNKADAGADSILHCDAYGNLRDAFAKSLDAGGTASDTLHVDPSYNMMGTYLTGWYQAKASLVRDKANGYADYMGWELWSPETRLEIGGKGHGTDGKVGHHR